MQLKELKEKVLTKSSIQFPIVFIASNNDFLVNEYLYAISKNCSLELKYVQSISEIEDITSSIFYENNFLFIYKPEKDIIVKEEDVKNYRVIIIYEKLPKENTIESVEFCKLENWMIEDYASTLLPGLIKKETDWLCRICQYNIERINIECEKLSIFNKSEQEKLFELINKENGYCDLNDLNIFNLTNAIIKKDMLTIKNIVKDIDNIDIEGTGLVTILLKQFYNIILVQMGKNMTPSKIGMSDKQYRAIQYNCNKYSNNKLISNYKFLNNIDYKLKSGLLELSNKDLVQYILNHIFSID